MEDTTFDITETALPFTNSTDITLSSWRNGTGYRFSTSFSVTWFTYTSLVISVVLVVVGLFGNTVTIILMRNLPFRANAHGIYLTALAAADIASLIVAPIRKRFVVELYGGDIRAISLAGCKLYTYAYRTTKICSSIFVVLICFERFMALWFPVKAKLLLAKRTGFILVCCIYVAVYVVSIAFALHAGVRNGRCLHDMVSENDTFSYISANVAWALNSLIPTASLVLLTPLTITKLCHRRTMKKRAGGQDKTVRTSYITSMLMSAFLAYICLITSFSVTFQVFKFRGINLPRSTEPWAIGFMEIMQIAEQANYAINFFLYGFYNSEFRRQFLLLFACLRHTRPVYETDDNESSIQSDPYNTGKTESSHSTNSAKYM